MDDGALENARGSARKLRAAGQAVSGGAAAEDRVSSRSARLRRANRMVSRGRWLLYLFSPADSLDTAGGTRTPREPPGRESGEGKPLPRVLSLAGDSSFGETDDHALNTYRKYCGFYFIYYFDTSKLKGRDSLIPRDSLLENTGDGSREYHLRPEPFSFNLHERPRFPAAGGTERPETVRRTVFNGGRAAALDGSRSAVE